MLTQSAFETRAINTCVSMRAIPIENTTTRAIRASTSSSSHTLSYIYMYKTYTSAPPNLLCAFVSSSIYLRPGFVYFHGPQSDGITNGHAHTSGSPAQKTKVSADDLLFVVPGAMRKYDEIHRYTNGFLVRCAMLCTVSGFRIYTVECPKQMYTYILFYFAVYTITSNGMAMAKC